jgi:hypothetical protein
MAMTAGADEWINVPREILLRANVKLKAKKNCSRKDAKPQR